MCIKVKTSSKKSVFLHLGHPVVFVYITRSQPTQQFIAFFQTSYTARASNIKLSSSGH